MISRLKGTNTIHIALGFLTATLCYSTTQATTDEIKLPPVEVTAPSVAVKEPTGSFEMPVTALRFNPAVDIQGRNSVEAQGDISIRGGTFENTAIKLGGINLWDPQTGHYTGEIPVSPNMLQNPNVKAGFEQYGSAWGTTAGAIEYDFKRIHTNELVLTGLYGSDNLFVFDGYASAFNLTDATDGSAIANTDVAYSYSIGDGGRPNGDHKFDRIVGRTQVLTKDSQTDVVVGQQNKQFGWENLYTATPGRIEREDITTTLVGVNNRIGYGAEGSYTQSAFGFRRNEDHYSLPEVFFNAYHQTDIVTIGNESKHRFSDTYAVKLSAGVAADEIDSTTLIFGPAYTDRIMGNIGAIPEITQLLNNGKSIIYSAGASVDYSNRDEEAINPGASIELINSNVSFLRSVRIAYNQSSQVQSYTALKSRPLTVAPFPLFAGNPNLGRSYAQNFELSSTHNLDEWIFKSTLYFRKDSDLTDWTYNSSTPNVRQANAVDIDNYGYELIASKQWDQFTVSLGYNFLAKNEDYGNAAVDASFYALNYARHRAVASVSYRVSDRVRLFSDNEFRIQEENELRSGSDTPFLSSLGLNYSPFQRKDITFIVRVDNVFDTDYQEVPLVPSQPRSYSAGVTVKF